MSKKKFKAGLESLFGDIGGEDQLSNVSPLLVEEEANKRKPARPKRPKKRSSKNFTADLEDLFHNALDKEYKETKERQTDYKGRDTKVKKRTERPVIGIDALIRRTTNDTKAELGVSTPLKKRVTFTLEKHKVEKLKSIAKSKKAYLKDIVDDIISQYLNKTKDPDHPPSVN